MQKTNTTRDLCPHQRSIREGLPRPLYICMRPFISSYILSECKKKRRMGRPDGGDRRCKRHPKHREAEGVCPFCLREKLAYLLSHSSSSSSSAASYLSSSSSSSVSSLSSSSDSGGVLSCAPSPPRQGARAGRGKLGKSRSLIMFAGRGRKEEIRKEGEAGKGREEKKKEKERFWSKLLSGGKSGRQRKEKAGGGGELLHSQTFKEKPSTKWI